MPKNASGVMSKPSGTTFSASTTIESAKVNLLADDIVSALTGDLPRDGAAAMTGNLPMGTNRITGLGSPSAGTDAATKDYVDSSTLGLADPGADRILFWDDSEGTNNHLVVSDGLYLTTTNLSVDKATAANIRSAASNKVVTADGIETASALVALTDAATVAVDWDAFINGYLTVTASRIIGSPSNGQPGTWRTILVQGNDTTDRAITFASNYLGDVPTINDCDSARWYLLSIMCITTSHFIVSSKRAKGS